MTKILDLPSEGSSYSLAPSGVPLKELKLTDAVIADWFSLDIEIDGRCQVLSEFKKCPKCGGEMRMGKLLARDNPIKHYDLVFEDSEQRKLLTEKKWLVAYACENCGYVESYAYKPDSTTHG